ncbi:GNAT family N-acetyltransferase [Streptomyces sp. 150FB]|uniref:GNAT family N-acetyltransferase n=1 Tax=Streptomyces sp. 150FB TaxID=1576605 RepID=UPI000A6985D9|nr:GNAT family N-acetyltransferase [Streptomyces sp. 150FB]
MKKDLDPSEPSEPAQLPLPAPPPLPALSFRRADENDLSELVRLRDSAARWHISRGIDQWKPGALGEDHFRKRLAAGEVWIASLGPDGPVAGAWELWWADPAAWGTRPGDAGHVHRLMTDRATAPPGTGRLLLAEAERRVAATGRSLCRLDCLSDNRRLRAYYAAAGYTAVGEVSAQDAGAGPLYVITLLEKRLPAVRDAGPAPVPTRAEPPTTH